jgi:hypothetical protein
LIYILRWRFSIAYSSLPEGNLDINSVKEETRGAKEDGGVTWSTGKTCREDMEYDVT